ncbi:MAG: cell envelope integrity protein TolA [Candidatus Kapabacteria bacterium]|jgi:TonB family protein|nr:cell envelope integrity protein TolA [Candidatus Kapabacteria bacterium]
MSRQYNNEKSFSIKFVWNPEALKSFAIGCGILLVIAGMSTCIAPPEPDRLIAVERPTDPILIQLGLGDDPRPSGGNTIAPGVQSKGQTSPRQFQAVDPGSSASGSTTATPPESDWFVPKNNVNGPKSTNPNATADGGVHTGTPKGQTDGTGSGLSGNAAGAGYGIGPVEWAGGGNRQAVYTQEPRYPPGTMNARVQLQFTVRPDGTVASVRSLRRGGNPAVDKAAIDALYRWRFNRLTTDVEMTGVITFSFQQAN